jgi:hypothetical protein
VGKVLRAEAFEAWSQATCAWNSARLGLLRRGAANLTTVQIQDAGHSVHRENFPAYLATVRAFPEDQ